MEKFQAKRRVRRTLYAKTTLAILFVVVLFLAHSVWGAYQKYLISGTALDEEVRQNEKLSERTRALTDDIGRLSTERGVEAEVRAHFQVAKPGEEVVVVVDSDKPVATSTPILKKWYEFWK